MLVSGSGFRVSESHSGPVLVTGAAGFIGSHLVRRLRSNGYRVVGLDAFRGTTTASIAAVRLAELDNDPGFELTEMDLLSGSLDHVVQRVAPVAIFHLAARPGARDADPSALARDNVRATTAVVSAAVAAGVSDLVFASSSSVYGDAGSRGPSCETDEVSPMSAYAATKRTGELLCLNAGLRSRVVRLFTVYGPGQRSDMAFHRFITAALERTSAPRYQQVGAARDFTYVADAVEGLLLAWRYGRAPIYNVSGGKVVTLDEVLTIIAELTGSAPMTHAASAPLQPMVTRADLTLAQAQLGYWARFGLRDGLALQVAAAMDARLIRVTGPDVSAVGALGVESSAGRIARRAWNGSS
ncbi:MAG: galE [Pseudonocardiales bacterium]|nr:galE [Pseudonocardiales bacterium]